MELTTKKFKELSVAELYEILKLRTDVFVVEQACAYPELDNHDQTAIHLIGTENNVIVAYSRLAMPGSVYKQLSIGRVAVHSSHRKKGYGRIVFDYALKEARKDFDAGTEIKIQAQIYLEDFYKSFGFEVVSEPYPDVGVWHVDMLLKI